LTVVDCRSLFSKQLWQWSVWSI